ncbi:MAG: hypothetical protein PHV59_10925 [Victivallales bacterium]|nr:hypothetical protein [Victivallales bacterium]
MSGRVIIILFLIFSVSGNLPGQNYYGTRTRNYPLPKTTLERLGENALNIARQRLAADSNDAKGLILLNFAAHLIPSDRGVLLVRGQLKFKVPLEAPRRKFSEKEFLALLAQARDHINEADTAMNRHLLIILNQLIRTFNPREEDAIIALMQFADKGMEIDLNKLLAVSLDSITDTKYDPKDSRYAISDVRKTISISANVDWTDTLIKVSAGKTIKISAYGTWSMGGDMDFPTCGADGYPDYDIETLREWAKNKGTAKKNTNRRKKRISSVSLKTKRTGPGCLLARIGKKEYIIGTQATFRAETGGILYLGPYEWDDYLDNYGSLTVTIEVSD